MGAWAVPGAVARQHCIPSGVATTLHPIYANRKYPLSPRCGHPSDGNAGRCMSVRFGRRAAMAFLANVRIGPNEPSQRRRRTAHVWVREAWSDLGYQVGRQVQRPVLSNSYLIARNPTDDGQSPASHASPDPSIRYIVVQCACASIEPLLGDPNGPVSSAMPTCSTAKPRRVAKRAWYAARSSGTIKR